MSKNPTPVSMLGSILVANQVKIGWVILILANMLWIYKSLKDKNKEAIQLHAFYVVNSAYAILNLF